MVRIPDAGEGDELGCGEGVDGMTSGSGESYIVSRELASEWYNPQKRFLYLRVIGRWPTVTHYEQEISSSSGRLISASRRMEVQSKSPHREWRWLIVAGWVVVGRCSGIL